MIDPQWILIILVSILAPYQITCDKTKALFVIKTVSWKLKTSNTGFVFELSIVQWLKATWDRFIDLKVKEKLNTT